MPMFFLNISIFISLFFWPAISKTDTQEPRDALLVLNYLLFATQRHFHSHKSCLNTTLVKPPSCETVHPFRFKSAYSPRLTNARKAGTPCGLGSKVFLCGPLPPRGLSSSFRRPLCLVRGRSFRRAHAFCTACSQRPGTWRQVCHLRWQRAILLSAVCLMNANKPTFACRPP